MNVSSHITQKFSEYESWDSLGQSPFDCALLGLFCERFQHTIQLFRLETIITEIQWLKSEVINMYTQRLIAHSLVMYYFAMENIHITKQFKGS